MKIRIVAIVLFLVAMVATVVLLLVSRSDIPARPVRLDISGPAGQRFNGSYVADGVTNGVSAIAPASFRMNARNVRYEFERDQGDGEFRVALYVNDLCRTSTTSGRRKGVHGLLKYSGNSESYWAAGF